MTNWTIIRVEVQGGYYYDALEASIDPALDLHIDGETIEAGEYEIVLEGIDEDDAMRFMDMSAGERDAVYILNKNRP